MPSNCWYMNNFVPGADITQICHYKVMRQFKLCEVKISCGAIYVSSKCFVQLLDPIYLVEMFGSLNGQKMLKRETRVDISHIYGPKMKWNYGWKRKYHDEKSTQHGRFAWSLISECRTHMHPRYGLCGSSTKNYQKK